ncbi:MAG: patatin-like phospholipase family protein [Bryobacteraceae bacterium]|nr:patatin-like phospholipase family protein [Bryobacteraceae bacterium]MDW8377469.1 patatin-like phospholipase family protein [Bryobacterales bacterium]
MNDTPATARRQTIGLALSGGGFRATLFHLGALRRLNDFGLLSRIQTISSVSGGSITSGLLASRWLSLKADASGRFVNFEEQVERPLREFCSRNLRNQALFFARLNPRNWWNLLQHNFSVTNLLAGEYERDLLNGATLQTLREILEQQGPRFVFCATNLATGVNWRFEGDRVGDYLTGYAWKPDLPLGVAIAASSAYPVVFPPLVLKWEDGPWKFGPQVSGTPLSALRKKVCLTDGGVYDNLGLEPVWKRHDIVLCSDAGLPFRQNPSPRGHVLARLKRSIEIIDRQSLSLRRRWLLDSLVRGRYQGAYWGIATRIEDYPLEPKATGYGDATLQAICEIRTDLNVFTEGEQLVLMNHGWLLAGAAIRAYLPQCSQPDLEPPDRKLLDGSKALEALQQGRGMCARR